MGRKGIQVDEEVFNAVKLMYPDVSWTNILKMLLEPKGLPKDKPKGLHIANGSNGSESLKTSKGSLDDFNTSYATKDDLKALKDKFSMVLTQLIEKNKLQR